MLRLIAGAMDELSTAAVIIILWCCAAPQRTGSTIPVTVRSHNRSEVQVYLLCGERDAEWLGVVSEKEVQFFEIPAPRARCALGFNFFLVTQKPERGYWVGPVRPVPGERISLVIEKYAPLSTAITMFD